MKYVIFGTAALCMFLWGLACAEASPYAKDPICQRSGNTAVTKAELDSEFAQARAQNTEDAYRNFVFCHRPNEKHYNEAVARLDEVLHPKERPNQDMPSAAAQPKTQSKESVPGREDGTLHRKPGENEMNIPVSPFVVIGAVLLLMLGLFVLQNRREPEPTAEELEVFKQEEIKRLQAREKEEKEQRRIESWGHVNPALVCPHCQSKGTVRAKQITQKTGVSGGKATAAVLTGGLSVVVAGLSRKEDRTQCACEHCGMAWVV